MSINVDSAGQDEFALESQRRTAAAIQSGRFDDEITPVPPEQKGSPPVLFSVDEHPRPDTTMEALARLKPAFRTGGAVTAGNSSGISGGDDCHARSGPQARTEHDGKNHQLWDGGG